MDVDDIVGGSIANNDLGPGRDSYAIIGWEGLDPVDPVRSVNALAIPSTQAFAGVGIPDDNLRVGVPRHHFPPVCKDRGELDPLVRVPTQCHQLSAVACTPDRCHRRLRGCDKHTVAIREDLGHANQKVAKTARRHGGGGVVHNGMPRTPPCHHEISLWEHLETSSLRAVGLISWPLLAEDGQRAAGRGMPDRICAIRVASGDAVTGREDLAALHLLPAMIEAAAYQASRGVPQQCGAIAAPCQELHARGGEPDTGYPRGVTAQHPLRRRARERHRQRISGCSHTVAEGRHVQHLSDHIFRAALQDCVQGRTTGVCWSANARCCCMGHDEHDATYKCAAAPAATFHHMAWRKGGDRRAP
mmetsp:Transcript_68111/g.197404  ORF Transcript_68111/g.197404 Transcript_68111/m.197404 type:complete len:359 (+) Transcript_68111:354-1430(+)